MHMSSLTPSNSICPTENSTVRAARTLCRDEYTVDQLVGGHSGKFTIAGRACIREDTVLVGWPPVLWLEGAPGLWGALLLSPTRLATADQGRCSVAQTNKAGQKLQCSHFRLEMLPRGFPPPVVIYCHCNSGSRRDAEEALHVLLPHGITVFTLDFAVRRPSLL